MKMTMGSSLLGFTLMLCAVSVLAESRVVEVWQCKLKEGKTAAEVQAANRKWLEFVNSKVKGGGVQSYQMTAIVGHVEGFVFADSYPSMDAWVAAKAALKTPEGEATEAAIAAYGECTSNTLYNSEEA